VKLLITWLVFQIAINRGCSMCFF